MTFSNDEVAINQYLEGTYNTVIVKDIIKRNNIDAVTILEDVTRFIFDNVGNLTTSKKISDTLTSNQRKTSQPTVEKYLEYLQECFMIYKVGRYDVKGKQHLKSLAKYYLVDTGLRNYLLGYRDIDRGFVLENLVYIELIRRGYKVYVGKIDDEEIDFIATKANEILYIQVAETVKGEAVLTRELRPLKKVKDFYQRILITSDYDVNADYDGIKHINILNFLLAE